MVLISGQRVEFVTQKKGTNTNPVRVKPTFAAFLSRVGFIPTPASSSHRVRSIGPTDKPDIRRIVGNQERHRHGALPDLDRWVGDCSIPLLSSVPKFRRRQKVSPPEVRETLISKRGFALFQSHQLRAVNARLSTGKGWSGGLGAHKEFNSFYGCAKSRFGMRGFNAQHDKAQGLFRWPSNCLF